jgi:two-component system probable response regulator PhcQ
MQSFYDYKKYAILYVDDEDKSLKNFKLAFADQFKILTANNAADGFKLFEENKDELAILMTDQRMPGEKGVQLLEKARQLRPRVIRILATAYSDMDAAVAAVNQGSIYKYVHKPWDPHDLEITLKRGLEFFIVQKERDQLLKEKLSVLHNMMITDRIVSLGILAAGLSHHLRNSLVAVRTFLDLAPGKLKAERVSMDELRNPNYWRDFYDHVQGQVKRITDLLSDLGAAADPASAAFKDEVSITTVFDAALATVQSRFKEKNIQVINRLDGDVPTLFVDHIKFTRLFELILIDEAVNLPAGSTIIVSAKKLEGADGESEVAILIEDNGPGLPEASLRSVFDPFFLRQDNPQEFGINLMAAYFIVYHHGGRIVVASDQNTGVRFTLTLPRKPKISNSVENERDFISKVLLNDSLWDKLLTES